MWLDRRCWPLKPDLDSKILQEWVPQTSRSHLWGSPAKPYSKPRLEQVYPGFNYAKPQDPEMKAYKLRPQGDWAAANWASDSHRWGISSMILSTYWDATWISQEIATPRISRLKDSKFTGRTWFFTASIDKISNISKRFASNLQSHFLCVCSRNPLRPRPFCDFAPWAKCSKVLMSPPGRSRDLGHGVPKWQLRYSLW